MRQWAESKRKDIKWVNRETNEILERTKYLW